MCAIEYYTYEDYKNWEGRWELMDGIPMAMSPAPLPTHQLIASYIIHQLNSSLKECEECVVLGEVDYKVDEETILRPDVVLTCEKLNKPFIVAPQLIFEIVSKSSVRRDEKFKFEIYEKEKVKYYVLVYPDDRLAKAYELKGNRFEKMEMGDKYEFENLTCKASVDFGKIFEKFKFII